MGLVLEVVLVTLFAVTLLAAFLAVARRLVRQSRGVA
jgi:hypothetical protein